MPQTYTRNTFTLHIRRVKSWQVPIILAGTFAIAAALAVVASGLFLLLLPVVFVGAIAYRFLGPGRANFQRQNPSIIDGEYVVVSDNPLSGKTLPLNEAPKGRVTT